MIIDNEMIEKESAKALSLYVAMVAGCKEKELRKIDELWDIIWEEADEIDPGPVLEAIRGGAVVF